MPESYMSQQLDVSVLTAWSKMNWWIFGTEQNILHRTSQVFICYALQVQCFIGNKRISERKKRETQDVYMHANTFILSMYVHIPCSYQQRLNTSPPSKDEVVIGASMSTSPTMLSVVSKTCNKFCRMQAPMPNLGLGLVQTDSTTTNLTRCVMFGSWCSPLGANIC